MTKTKIKFRASSVETKKGTLYYQVTHNRVVRQIHTEYRIYPSEWDAEKSAIVIPPSVHPQRQAYLQTLREALKADCKRLSLIAERLEADAQPYTSDLVVACYLEAKALKGFVSYAVSYLGEIRSMGKARMADRYATTINSLQRYLKGEDILLEKIDGTLLQGYEQFLKERGLCRNTTSFYMRNLRTIYNHAVEEGLVVSSSPFKHVYTGIDKTVKRALPFDIVRKLKRMDLSTNPQLDLARDLFMFSFYTRGMPFVDMAKLTDKNLNGGVLTYRRQKTSQQLHVKWEKPMQDIVDKYHRDDSPYLLPIASGTGATFWQQYKNAYSRINRQLKQLGKMLGLSIPLTTYVARHSWASIARSQDVALSTISEALGHDSEKTTRIYLATLDTSVVDDANHKIIGSL